MLREYWLAGATRRYGWAAAALTAGYVLATIAAGTVLPPLRRIEPRWLRAAVALLPLAFMLAMAWLEYSRIRRTDELRQRIELEAGTLALIVSILLVVALGLLERAGLPTLPLLYVGPAMCGVYVAAQAWASRRYR